MSEKISRRLFLALTGGVLATPSRLWAVDAVPAELDHIILGISDLDRGIAFVEERTGVRAAFGGVHPGGGTRNALLSLGTRRYLEILALDPQQSELPKVRRRILQSPIRSHLRELREPRLIGWAVHTSDIAAVAHRLSDSGLAVVGPNAGSRARPDGKTLRWKTLLLKDDRDGLLPFFIEWSRDSLHPSVDAPAGCRLERFSFESPDPAALAQAFRRLEIQAEIARGEKPRFRVRIAGPRGVLDATS